MSKPDYLRQARVRKGLQFGVYINHITLRERDNYRKPISLLKKYRRTFKAASKDRILGELMRIFTEVADEMLNYCYAKTKGDELAARRYKAEAERLWEHGSGIADRIAEEMSDDV